MADLPDDIAAAVENGTAIVCFAKCWPCQFGQCMDPPQWHTWADDEDTEHAAATGQPDPTTSRCGCPCAVVDPTQP